MKAVVIGEPSGATMEQIKAVFPRHKAVVDLFVSRGDVIGIGPFADLGNMAIFRTREAAEAFTGQDPFILEGLVKSVVIRDWNDTPCWHETQACGLTARSTGRSPAAHAIRSTPVSGTRINANPLANV